MDTSGFAEYHYMVAGLDYGVAVYYVPLAIADDAADVDTFGQPEVSYSGTCDFVSGFDHEFNHFCI